MDIAHFLFDFILHVDKHLVAFVTDHGAWVYVLLFAIIFIETGVVVSMGLLTLAAIAGNQSNYAIGRRIGPKVFQWEQSRFFNKRAFEQAHAFYEKHGGFTIVAARFMPFLRTFAPFVAGVSQMSRSKFTFFDVTGGTLWVVGVTLAGYFFGNFPFVKAHLDKIIWSMILVPGLLTLLGSWRASRKAAKAANDAA
jgi:membrane-associated protein